MKPTAPASLLDNPQLSEPEFGNFLFVTGQVTQADEVIVGDDIIAQTHQVFKNLKALLADANAGLVNVIITTVYLKNLGDFAAVNEIYRHEFGEHHPARSIMQVETLPRDVRIEIETIAVLS